MAGGPPGGDRGTPTYGYYEPPLHSRGRPAVITWFRVYAVTSIFLYLGFLGFLALWQFLTPAVPNEATSPTPIEAVAVLAFIVFICVAFAAFYGVAAMVPYKPWGWTMGLVAITLGLMSCMAVASVPLLIYWLKPETRAAFGRL